MRDSQFILSQIRAIKKYLENVNLLAATPQQRRVGQKKVQEAYSIAHDIEKFIEGKYEQKSSD